MSDTATELLSLAHRALTDLLDPASTVPDKAELLETVLVIRDALVDAFDRTESAGAATGIWNAVDHIDLAIVDLIHQVPELADEVAALRPVFDIPDSPLEG